MTIWRRQRATHHLIRDIIYGALAGVAGTLAMQPVTRFLYKHEREDKRRREQAIRREGAPLEVLARRFIELVGAKATERRTKRLARMLHWSYGIGWGSLFGVLHDRVPVLSRARATPFGLGFFLIGDEAMNVLLGLTPPPKAYPIDAHVRGLAGHLAYAAAADGTYHTLRRFLP